MTADASAALLLLAEEQYVLLTTTRRTGVAVPTAVWVARDGDSLIVVTAAAAGKTKRIRHTPRVTLQACDRVGTPTAGAPVIHGRATVDETAEARERLHRVFRAKYGAAYAAIRALQKVRMRAPESSVVLRITSI